MRLPLVTTSEMKCFRRCNREHHFAYTMGVRSAKEEGPLRFGTMVHTGLESVWKKDDALANWLPNEGVDPFDLERASAMLDGYALFYANDDYEVLGVELQFTAPLINPDTGHASVTYELGGKLDALVRDRRTGDVWIVEHKTSSEDITPGSQYWAKLRLDSQVSTYMLGAKALGHKPVGVLYDVLKKPGIKPLKATPEASKKYTKEGKLYANMREADETPYEYGQRCREAIAADPENYYVRGDVVRLDDELLEAQREIWQYVGRIRDARRTGIAPRNPEACSRFGRMCTYWPVCSGEASIDDATRYVKIENVHQELTIEEGAQ